MKTKNTAERQPLILGAHFSIAKGLHQAVYTASHYGCTALQIFTKNASTWKERILTPGDIQRFREAVAGTGMNWVASHGAYLINPASPDNTKWRMSRDALQQEMIRCTQLGIALAVLHPGAHMGTGEKAGMQRIADCINSILSETPDLQTRLLLETTAGQGSSIGHTFEQLAAIMERVSRKDLIGVCLDTAHIFAAGYDIRDRRSFEHTIAHFDKTIGLPNLLLLHLNDSKKPLGACVDRHEHIGRGTIGLSAFGYLMNDPRLQRVPKIIETPKNGPVSDWDRANLTTLRRLCRQDTTPG